MRLITKIGIIASILALGVFAFPINTQAQKSEPFVFTIQPKTQQSPVVYGPYASEVPKPDTTKKPEIKQVKNKKASAKKSDTSKFNPCNCWSYVFYKTGGNMPTGYGKARNYPVNSHTPQVGAIIITYESSSGHMGIVAGVDESFVTIDDYNFERCSHTIRTLPLNSTLIKGYIL